MASLLDNITDFANQSIIAQLPDGTTAELQLIYQGATERWLLNVSYGEDFSVMGINVCCLPNILRQWRNIIPFGLACTTDDQTDPFTVEDFASGRASLYLLTAEDVLEVETAVFEVAS